MKPVFMVVQSMCYPKLQNLDLGLIEAMGKRKALCTMYIYTAYVGIKLFQTHAIKIIAADETCVNYSNKDLYIEHLLWFIG